LAATTEEDIKRNREWMETISQLKQLWQSLVNTIATTLIPVLRQVANVFGYIMQYKPVLEGLLIGIAVLIGVGIVNAIRAAAVAAAGFMATIAPILPILIGIGLLIKGISYIKDKLSPGMKKFNEPINPNDSRMYNNIKRTMPGSRTTSNSYGGAVSNNTSNTKIDTVTINTAATDSKGIARAFYGDMKIIGAQGGAF
jgi:predicted tellurium resistance membrane protein TerC